MMCYIYCNRDFTVVIKDFKIEGDSFQIIQDVSLELYDPLKSRDIFSLNKVSCGRTEGM